MQRLWRSEGASRAVKPRRWRRGAAWGAVLGLAALLVGDRAGVTASVQGIDPLEILDLQVKPNVVFVVDTSASMGRTIDGSHLVGGDDPNSRLSHVKAALRDVIAANDGKAQIGLAHFSPGNSRKKLIAAGGPLVYVSTDAAAANWVDFFDDIESIFSNYDGDTCPVLDPLQCSKEVFRSFATDGSDNNGFDQPFQGRHYIQSRLFRNGLLIQWNRSLGAGIKDNGLLAIDNTITCPPAPLSLFPDDPDATGDGLSDLSHPCFQLQDPLLGEQPATYYYASGLFGLVSAADAGQVGTTAVGVPRCTAASNAQALQNALRPEMPLDSSGAPIGITADPNLLDVNNQPNAADSGIRLGGPNASGADSPLGETLRAVHNHYDNVVFPARPPAVDGKQKSFVIMITDGRDDPGGVNAVDEADDMFADHGTNNRMETLVVGYAVDDATASSLDSIAQAGSGGARGAFRADTPQSLEDAIEAAVAEAVASGTFATESSITESIFEYVALAGSFNPNDPITRYNGRVPVLLQSSFDMPGFKGHLKAFICCDLSGNAIEKWDAGTKLLQRVQNIPSTGATFAALHGGAVSPPLFKPSPGALIQRRIFTSLRSGVFPYGLLGTSEALDVSAQEPALLWPPEPAIAPADDSQGALDAQLGITHPELPDDASRFDRLQSDFKACRGTGAPVNCSSADPGVRFRQARKEAREMILAFTAGAQVRTSAALPVRDAAGELLYVRRAWVLAESTLGVPAVITPPLEARPTLHAAEYNLFRDGPRDSTGKAQAGLVSGFGLRNPDKDGNPVSASDANLKPVMSVVYHAANDMLHAFRGGPENCTAASSCPPSTFDEGGGEELWGFVPNDQLGKLRERMEPQGRDPHTYMIASPLRFTDVFVPDPDGFTVQGRSFTGRWRTVLVFGRGIGGKHYTALDVSVTGRFNQKSLDTLPPLLLWNRGNPDTQDGLAVVPGTNENFLTNDTPADDDVDLGENDRLAYATMGESWSVPAIASVPIEPNLGREFAAFMGSGYSEDPDEGQTFYVVDVLTGDILHTSTVPPSSGTCTTEVGCVVPQNALVANAAAFIPAQLAPGFVGNPAASQASFVYIGDLHGQIWKWITARPEADLILFKDLTVDQPIANGVALLNLNSKPHVFLSTGDDRRVNAPPNFKLGGFRDDSLNNVDPFTGLATTQVTNQQFVLDFGPLAAGLDFTGFRGTAQPATAFGCVNPSIPATCNLGRVFFIGTKFDPGTECLPRFDSVLFALGAQSGGAAYDLNAGGEDRAALLAGQKVQAIRGARGEIVLDQGALGSAPPPPPPPPAPATNVNSGTGEVIVTGLKTGSAVCR